MRKVGRNLLLVNPSEGGKMDRMNQKLLKEARALFMNMVEEGDADKRRDLKIEINDLCLKGKFDYTQFVYRPMAAAIKGAVGKA